MRVDNEGEVLDFVVQRSRDAKVAAKLIKKLVKRYGTRILSARVETLV